MRKVSSALFTTQRDNNINRGSKKPNGLLLLTMAPRHQQVASSPALIEPKTNPFGQRLVSPCDDGLSLCAMFKLIAQRRICVVRRAGSDVEQQITSIIETAFRAVGRLPPSSADGSSPSEAYFLTVDHYNAGKMLDRMRRQGLPLIFLNGNCVGGLTELKRLMSSGFLAESLCAHNFDLIVIGCGEGNAVAERAVEEATKLGKRVALVEIKQNSSRKARIGDAQIAKQTANQAALMRHSIEEAQLNGWTVESSGDGKTNFWLDWRCVREAIERKTKLKRDRTTKAFERGKVQLFSVSACQFFGSHQLTFCRPLTESESAHSELAKISADKFLLVPMSEWKGLENLPGAREFCISNDQLFSLNHNPGRTLFFCDAETDPRVLESAAILKALGNDVTLMTNNYSASSRRMDAKLEGFEPELIAEIKDKLCQLGVRFFISLPTKFECLREPTDDKSALLRVYATNAWSKSAEKGGVGDWAPFVEEFNTVVICVGRHSHFTDGLLLDNIGTSAKPPNSQSICDSFNHCTMNNGTTTRKIMGPSSELLLQAPNVFSFGGMERRRWGETTPQGQSEEGIGQRVRRMLREMYEAEFETMDTCEGGDAPMITKMLIPPMEYGCCGLNEEEAAIKFGRHLIRVYRDEQVPIMAERAKMICVKDLLHHKKECVVGLHIIGSKADQLLSGYALAMKLGLTKCQMERDNWQKSATFEQ